MHDARFIPAWAYHVNKFTLWVL